MERNVYVYGVLAAGDARSVADAELAGAGAA
jgi:hypothetical protein